MSFYHKHFLTGIIYLSQHFLTVYPYPISPVLILQKKKKIALHMGKRAVAWQIQPIWLMILPFSAQYRPLVLLSTKVICEK